MDRVDKEVALHGVIVTEPDNFGFKKSLTVEVDKIKVGDREILINPNGSSGQNGDGDVTSFWLENIFNIRSYFDVRYRKNRVRVIASCGDCKFGHGIDFSGTLSLPKVTEDFDSNIFLLSRGIQFEILNAKIAKIYALNSDSKLESALYDFKNLFVEKIKLVLPNKEESALGAGILITGKENLSKKTLNDFKRSGLIHMVVLSGFNVSIVAQVIIAILSSLPKMIAGTFGSVGIILFCIMVGGGATVVRSLIMSLIAIWSKVFNKNSTALEAVLIAGGLMIIQNPIIIVGDPSFQLSFACTLGLILLGNSSKYFFSFVPETFGLREIVSSTIAVQIFVLPLLLKFSGAISVYSVFANIIVVPCIPFAMLAVFIAGALCFISIDLASIFAFVSHTMLAYILFVVRYISGLDSAMLEIGKSTNLFVVCWYTIAVPVSAIMYKKFGDNLEYQKVRKLPKVINKKSIKIDG